MESLVEENIIKAPVGNPSGEDQLFRIKLVTKQLKRIRPIQITKPQSKIRFVKSDINILYDAINPINRVKVLCKIKNQSKAA